MVSGVFAHAMGVLFRDPNMGEDAIYRAGGGTVSVAIRVIASNPDVAIGFGETEILTGTLRLQVQIADAPDLARGDQFDLRGEVWEVYADPHRDSVGMAWSVGVVPADAG